MKTGKFILPALTLFMIITAGMLSVEEAGSPTPSSKKGEGTSLQWQIQSHEISAQLDVQRHTIKATDLLTLKPGEGNLELFMNSSFKVLSVDSEGISKPLKFSFAKETDLTRFFPSLSGDAEESFRNASLLSIRMPKKALSEGKMVKISVSYEGEVYDPPKTAEFSRENIADQTTGVIGEEGVYLSEATHWYPDRPVSISSFKLDVSVPSSYEVVSEGDLVSRVVDKDTARITWNVPYPTEGLHLVAGKYIAARSDFGKIEVSTFFFPEEKNLSSQYLSAVRNYLGMYEAMIGKYPFRKFSVVENFFPTGYGMPSFTLLGREVIKLPFIISTSLGHEVAHAWWGNSVFVDYEKGNWCEGLTAFFADYHYKELESAKAAEQYRREICRDYTNYVVQSGEDFPLRSFRERTTPATRAIGYGKTLMVFHMLKNLVGGNLFDETMKEFYARYIWKRASWDDIRRIFEEKSALDLGSFFTQWIEKKGAPMLRIENVNREEGNRRFFVNFRLVQEDGYFALTVPVEIETMHGKEIKKAIYPPPSGSQDFSVLDVKFETEAPPVSISIDPHQDIFRKLHPEEVPPLLSGMLGDKDQLILLVPSGEASIDDAYSEVAANLSKGGHARVKPFQGMSDDDLSKNSILILGDVLMLDKFKDLFSPFASIVSLSKDSFELNGRRYGKDSSLLFTVRNPRNSEKVISVFIGFDAQSLKASGKKLIHYGKYSYLAFTLGDNKDKGVLPVTSSPLIYKFF